MFNVKLDCIDKPATIMERENCEPTNFDSLFNLNVPHILENIFSYLDYKSFTTCKIVNKTWNTLFSTMKYRRHLIEKKIEKERIEERLFNAASCGNTEEVRRLIYDHMVDVNFVIKANNVVLPWKKQHRTPMVQASRRGHVSVVKVLLKAGADIERGDESNNTPLHWAALFSHDDIVKLLLDAGAKVDSTNSMMRTPLGFTHNSDIAKTLMEHGADPNKTDDHGYTSLHAAVSYCDPYMVKILIEGGADPLKSTKYGDTPFKIARRKGRKDIMKLIMDKISK